MLDRDLAQLYEVETRSLVQAAKRNISRFPTVQDFASYARLIRPTKTSAGKNYGAGNGRIGNSYLKWAFSEAVILFLRETREAQPYIRRLERKYGKEKAKGIVFAGKVPANIKFCSKVLEDKG